MTLVTILIFILGACIGSFLNVVILRVREGKSLGGRSHCPYCKHRLTTADLIPILSYLLLSGKCRYCRHQFSVQYPLVEALTALSFALIFLYSPIYMSPNLSNLLEFIFYLFTAAVLIVVSVYDLRWGLIPDKVVLPASVLAFAYQILLFVLDTKYMVLNTALAGFGFDILTALLVGLFFLFLIVITRGRGMGGGDLKLSVFIGLTLGFPGAIIGVLLAFLTGAAASVILLVTGKKGLQSQIPFGPFLALGAYIAILVGQDLWTAYLRLLGFN